MSWLERDAFPLRVEVADRTGDFAVVWSSAPRRTRVSRTRAGQDSLGGHEVVYPRTDLDRYLAARPQAGTWAYEARRIAAGVPRIGLDTDHRTIPNEIGMLGIAVHLDKGCYRGQETVARVHPGSPASAADPAAPRRYCGPCRGRAQHCWPTIGRWGSVGGSARHFELGPIALGLVKRTVPADRDLVVDGIAAAQELVVDPEVGPHVRAKL